MSEFEGFESKDEAEGIQYVGEDGTPEEASAEESLKERAAEPLPQADEPPATVPTPPPPVAAPVTDPAEELPPDPGFQILPHKGRPPGVYYNGIAVGVWIHENFYSESGAEIEQRLTLMGLDPALAKWYGKQRDARIEADYELANDPTVQDFARAEEQHSVASAHMREAFLAAQRKKSS